MTDHLAEAKQYLDIADSSDSKQTAFKKATQAIAKQQRKDPSLSHREIAKQVGRSRQYVDALVQWRTNGYPGGGPFARDTAEAKGRGAVEAKRVLKDPERVDEVISDLPTRTLQELADRADAVVAERREARNAEHQAGVTGRAVSDFRPDEYWMDKVTIRANRVLREAADLLQRGGGLFGAMSAEEAYEYWDETERLASEIRVALQERVRDEVKV